MAFNETSSNLGVTFSAAGRFPIIAKRRFHTKAEAQAFVDDTAASGTSVEGLIISVINDTVDASNNGVYYIKSIGRIVDGELVPGELVKAGISESTDLTLGDDITGGTGIIYSADTSVSTVLQNIYDKLGDSGISNLSGETNVVNIQNNVISIVREDVTDNSVAEGHIAILSGSSGLYAQMYYINDESSLDGNGDDSNNG